LEKKIFVPGGNGFLGKRIVIKLKEKGIPYVSLSLRDGYDFRNFMQTLELFKENKFDAIINCAAFVGGIQFGYEKPAELYYNNTIMATNLMEAARQTAVKKFVNPISNCSYPAKVTTDFKEDEWWEGELHESVLVYGFVRKASWVQSWAYNKQYGFQTVNLILPNMYGPGDHFEEKRSHALGALVMKMVEAKRKNLSQVIIWGTGAPIREWLYVDDGVEALIRGLDLENLALPINVGVGKGISVSNLANLIKEIVGYKGDLVFDATKPDGAPHKTMNTDRMRQILKWEPSMSLKEGIANTVEWYLENVVGSL
jgi:GDP-L-fucose synthase